MRILVFTLMTLAFAAPLAAQEDSPFDGVAEKIAKHCRAEWPTEFTMQEYCVNRAREAWEELRVLVLDEDYAGLPTEQFHIIVSRCVRDWSPWQDGKQDTYDYVMIHYCADREIQAYKRLNQ